MTKDVAAGIAKPTFFHTIKLVAWSFMGIRSKQGYQDDLARVNPMHVIAVGIGAALMLVVGLIVLVNWVVAK